MRCLHASCLALFLIAACASAPRSWKPFELEDHFPVVYEGRIAALCEGDRKSASETQVELPGAGPSVAFRSTIVELPEADARALAPGAFVPVPTGNGLQLQGGHTSDATLLRGTLHRLASLGCLRSQPYTIARIGTTSTTTACTQTAYVSGFKIAGTLWAKVVDPEVEVFEHGTTLTFTPERDGDALTVSIDWLQSEPERPIQVARADRFALQVPVFTRQRLKAVTRLHEHDALVVGVLPGREPGMVSMLFVESSVVGPHTALTAIEYASR